MRGAGNKILELDYKAFTHYVATHRTKKKKKHILTLRIFISTQHGGQRSSKYVRNLARLSPNLDRVNAGGDISECHVEDDTPPLPALR